MSGSGRRGRGWPASDAVNLAWQYGLGMVRLASVWDRSRKPARLKTVTEVSQYGGERAIEVACTQLRPEYTATQARKIVEQWAQFFAAGPSPITELHFVTRTPKRLFVSLERPAAAASPVREVGRL